MAPEVCLCKLYGLSADVYGFSLLFHYLMTLELPYQRYNIKQHMKNVVLGGERPNGKKLKVPTELKEAILSGWNENPHTRPSMAKLCDLIQDAVVRRKQDVQKNKRMSTVAHIFDRSRALNEKSVLSMVGEGNEEEE
jgi:hypothetical protein